MRIAIVEDDAEYTRELREYLVRLEKEIDRDIEVFAYGSGLSFLKDFKGQFDILLLDISMPYLDGMETARRVRETDPEVMILFITNLAQYAIKGYEVDALDYIVKPVNYFAFSQRMMRAISRIGNREAAYLAINQKGGVRKLDIRGIYYVESLNHNLTFHTREGDYTVFGSLKDVEQRLSAHHFVRCNKGYLVSLRHVDRIEDGCAVVQGKPLLISRNRRNSFLEALANYFGDSMV